MRGDAEPLLPNGDGLTYDDVHGDIEDLIGALLGMREDAPGRGRSRRGKRTKKPNCTTGRSCGMSCVDRAKACEPDLSSILKAAASAVGRGATRQSINAKSVELVGTVGATPINPKKAQDSFKKAKAAYDKIDAEYKAALAAAPDANPFDIRSKFQSRISSAYRAMVEAESIVAAAKTIKAGRDFVGPELIDVLNGKAKTSDSLVLALKKELEVRDAAYQKIFDTSDDPFSTPEWKAYIKVVKDLKDAEESAGVIQDPMAVIRDKLLGRTNRDDADSFASRVKIAKSASNRHNEADLRSALADLYQISGGSSSALKSIKATESRAWADDVTNVINIGWGGDSASTTATLYHEVGHILETQSQEVVSAASGFRVARSDGDAKPMGWPYGDDEIAYPGKYINPYVGKVYGNSSGPTEVISMGIQHFSTAEDMMGLYEQDPEHFFLTIGALMQ